MRPFAAALCLASCAVLPSPSEAARPASPPGSAPLEVWVDGSAPGPGEGSRSRPFRALEGALAQARERALVVQLATGLYRGPFELPPGVRLVGTGAVVLTAEGSAVVHAPLGASLERLMVQGAGVGLVAGGEVELRAVKFSGQRDTAVRVEAGLLRARDCELAATMSQIRGLVVVRGAQARWTGGAFLGPYRRGVEAQEARVEISGARFEGPVVGVHQIGGSLRLEKTVFSGGRGPAVFSAQGELVVRGVAVLGHEYGLQTGRGTKLDLADFISVAAERAAVAAVEASGHLEDLVAVDSGSFGGIQLLSSELTMKRLRIHRPLGSGLLVRLGRLDLDEAVVSGVRDEEDPGGGHSGGDAVVIRGADVRLNGLTVIGARGACLAATAEATVRLTSAVLEECAIGGITSDQRARVDAVSLMVRRSGGPALAVPGPAVVRADLLTAEQNAGGLVWADCGRGAQVFLSRVRGDRPVPAEPCVRRWIREPQD